MAQSNIQRTSETRITIPGYQALAFVDLMKTTWQVPAAELLGPLGLNEQQLEEPEARIPVEVMNALVERGRERSGEPAIGVYLGLKKRASNYGFVGLAAMHARTLRQALELIVEFSATVTTAMGVRFEVNGDRASLRLIENIEIGPVRDVVLLSMLIGMHQIGKALTGSDIPGTADIALPKPEYFERFADLLGEIRFDQPDTRVVFDAQYLDLPLVAADRGTLRLARQQCERLLLELQNGTTFVDCVRRLIAQPRGFRTLEEVASRLHLSPRTLRRKLANHGVGFAELIDDERRKQALFLLRSSDRSLQRVGEELGYATLPNFVRAFKRWTGQTPAAYRRSERAARASLPDARETPTVQSMTFTERI